MQKGRSGRQYVGGKALITMTQRVEMMDDFQAGEARVVGWVRHQGLGWRMTRLACDGKTVWVRNGSHEGAETCVVLCNMRKYVGLTL